MSLNHLVNKPELKVEVADLSFGAGQWKTKQYLPTTSITNGNTILATGIFIYQCDDVSLRIRGTVNFTSAVTPANNLTIDVSLPNELKTKFSGANLYSTGIVSEYPFNANVNQGCIVSAEWDVDGDIINSIHYRQNQSEATNFRANFDIIVYIAVE